MLQGVTAEGPHIKKQKLKKKMQIQKNVLYIWKHNSFSIIIFTNIIYQLNCLANPCAVKLCVYATALHVTFHIIPHYIQLRSFPASYLCVPLSSSLLETMYSATTCHIGVVTRYHSAQMSCQVDSQVQSLKFF